MHIILPKSDSIKAVNCSINSNLYLFNAVNNNVIDAAHTLDISYVGNFSDTFTNSSGNKQVNVIAEIPPRISLDTPNGVSSGDDLYVVLTAACPKDQNDKIMNLYAGIRNPNVSNYAAFAHSDANSADYDSWFCILKAKAEPFTISIAVDSGNAFTNTVSLSSLGIYSEDSWNRMQQAALLQMYQRHVNDTVDPEVRYVDSSLQREITHVADPTRDDSAVNKKYVDSLFTATDSPVASKTYVDTAVRTKDIIDVKQFGAIGDGVTDDTLAFTNALNLAKSNGGGEIIVPQGKYLIKSMQLTSMVSIRGLGMPTLKVAPTIEGNDFISLKDGYQSEVALRNLIIDGSLIYSNKNNLINAIHIAHKYGYGANGIDHFDIYDNIIIKKFTGNGFYYESGTEVSMTDIRVYNADTNGFYIRGTDGKVLKCIAAGCVGNGFLVRCNQFKFIECKAFYCKYGFHIGVQGPGGQLIQTVFTACEAQNNGNSGFYIINTTSVVLNGIIPNSNNLSNTDNHNAEIVIESYVYNLQITGSIYIDANSGSTSAISVLDTYNCNSIDSRTVGNKGYEGGNTTRNISIIHNNKQIYPNFVV